MLSQREHIDRCGNDTKSVRCVLIGRGRKEKRVSDSLVMTKVIRINDSNNNRGQYTVMVLVVVVFTI